MNIAERALAAHQEGRLDEAEACYRLLIESAPHPGALNNLGLVLVAQHRGPEAVQLFERSLVVRPRHVNTLIALANALTLANRPLESIERCDEALAADPGNKDARHNKAVALRALNRYSEATLELEKLLSEDPADADAEYNLALCELVAGDYLRGWRHYDARRRGRKAVQPVSMAGIASWQPGDPLKHRRVLVQAEQGLGDTLHFARFVPRLAEHCASVEIHVQEPLVALLRRSFPGLPVNKTGADPGGERPELRIPLPSLPLALGLVDVAALAASCAYLHADADRAPPASLLAVPASARRIGFVWRGASGHQNDHNRSIALELFEPWIRAQLPAGTTIFTLQKGIRPEERRWLAQFPHVRILDEEMRDFEDTAAIIARLDGLVCVDTSVAHLSGAMGRATTLLLPFAPDWRWGLEGERTPLYPNHRLVRQSSIGVWTDQIDRLARQP